MTDAKQFINDHIIVVDYRNTIVPALSEKERGILVGNGWEVSPIRTVLKNGKYFQEVECSIKGRNFGCATNLEWAFAFDSSDENIVDFMHALYDCFDPAEYATERADWLCCGSFVGNRPADINDAINDCKMFKKILVRTWAGLEALDF